MAPLPSDLPARIYPPVNLDTTQLSGFSLISLLFTETFLGFVAKNSESQGQIFLWCPVAWRQRLIFRWIRSYLALQVYIPPPTRVPRILTSCSHRSFCLCRLTGDALQLSSGQQIRLCSHVSIALFRSRSYLRSIHAITPVDPNAIPGTSNVAGLRKNNSERMRSSVLSAHLVASH
ncbi:hypothetical protein BGW80DRAFT_1547801 [Lactifluus volemus]|nr:hypothetical protein BGW80DRAFT_1547801 [Lactifluus volemus]